LTFNGLRNVTSQKTELFITTFVTASNSAYNIIYKLKLSRRQTVTKFFGRSKVSLRDGFAGFRKLTMEAKTVFDTLQIHSMLTHSSSSGGNLEIADFSSYTSVEPYWSYADFTAGIFHFIL
jgi:hypothetical protein